MRLLTALLLSLASLTAAAQPAKLSGNTLDGQPFSLEALRGKVVMLFFWNTDCAPCIQKMPELRANAAGWRGKPFELVLVSTDRERAAALAYLQTLKQIEKNGPAMPALWAGDLKFAAPLAAPAAVPLTLVIDAKGAIVARHAGRIAPEAWDDVAGLLP
ncbi:thiol-disulfide isomerase/thioredoxin [Pelomonas saccharophila]|uniref:Thiol-disulfide isomerase/thioredoxin n=1 Tax=Roseateles saccharophilus TaxID=304 RepID=A0ABU1YLD7_ROSSA|nr:TlpA disulfide reductase family protein [Roseateles saccharophilus]MDR7269672.1 thiol-disulfide isomerase/thioredoxin [Roseateles saccharophilus]